MATQRAKKIRLILRTTNLNLAGKILYVPIAAFGKRGVAAILLITILSSTLFLFDDSANAATYTFSQSSWAGGTSASTLVHPTNQAGWTSYSSASNVTAGSNLTLATTSVTIVQSDDGTTNTGFNLSGTATSSTSVTGTGSAASVKLAVTGTPTTLTQTTDASTIASPGATGGFNSTSRVFSSTEQNGITGTGASVQLTSAPVEPQTYSSTLSLASGAQAIAHDGSGNLYIADSTTIKKYDSNNALVTSFAHNGFPRGLAVTSNGNTVYMPDSNASVVRIYTSSNGTAYTASTTFGSTGTGNGQFGSWGGAVEAVTVDSSGTFVYVADTGNKRIEKFNGFGVYISQWSTGTNSPYGISFDTTYTSLWVALTTANAVQKYSTSGALQTSNTFTTGTGDGQIGSSGMLSLGSDGTYLYVMDSGNKRVQKINPTGWAFVSKWGTDKCSGTCQSFAMDASKNTYLSQTSIPLGIFKYAYTSFAYSSSGTYTAYLDAGTSPSYSWNDFTWAQTANGGSISVKVKTTATAVAPSFASGTCDGSSSGTGATITLTDACRNSSHRYIWYQATLTAAAGNGATPTLDQVDVNVDRNAYNTSGTYTSGAIDPGFTPPNWNTLSWTQSGGQTITMKTRSSATSNFSGAPDWSSCTNITSDQALSTGGCVTNGQRYIQYQAALSTSNTSVSPSLDDLTIGYAVYQSSGSVTGNAYDAGDASNLMGGIAWTEDASMPSGTTVTVSLRTAATTGVLSGASWTDLTNASSGCSKSSGTVTCSSSALPAEMTSAGTNRYFQYKVTLGSTGQNTPTVSAVTATYVVNARPEFEAVPTAVQGSDGSVSITYLVRDVDTDTGTFLSGYVMPYFEYSLDNGSTWSAIASSSLRAEDVAQQSVSTSTYTTHTAVWNVTSQFTGQYDTDAKIRVTISDRELGNNIASSTSSAFTLDTEPPTVGAHPILIDASQATPMVTVSATDTSGVSMEVSIMSDFSDASYGAYAAHTALPLSSGDTVYARFKDAYGNQTQTYSAQPLPSPGNVFYQDTSNPNTSEWREFFAWGVADDPPEGFLRYNVYRSVDSGDFTPLTTVTDRLINYIVDGDLDQSSTYAYKVSVEDGIGNASFISGPTAEDQPDGTGGSDLAAPTIANVTAISVTTNTASITWTTNKLSDSTVYYSETSSYPGSDTSLYDDSTGIPSMVSSHTVVLSGLTPGSTYYFLVESGDSSNNIGDAASASYTFTTHDGPIISNVTTAEVFDNEATISWNTNVPADSVVYYSVNSDLSDLVEVSGSAGLSTNHSVTLTGLTQGTKYYYYVKSTDAESNEATDKNVVSGVIYYYTFNTSSDSQAPSVSNVSTALVGETGVTITWTTDEPATSQVEWGDSTGLGTLTTEANVFSRQHAVVLTGLTSQSTYYYRVISRDKSGNTTSDNNSGSDYSFTTLSPTTVRLGGGGGGGSSVDKTDPVISGIAVSFPTPTSALVSFITNKVANDQINYGATTAYGQKAGDLTSYRTTHAVALSGLTSGATYHYKITAANVYGGAGETADLTFTVGQEQQTQAPSEVPTEEPPSMLESLLTSASDAQLASVFSSFSKNAKPLIFGVDVTAKAGSDSATIEWVTDKPSNSLVSYSKAADYREGKPHTITSGNTDERSNTHKVTLTNLDPSTTYHFQVKSEGYLGAVAISNDGTFETTSLSPDITDTRLTGIAQDTATIEWKTALPSKSQIEVTNMTTGEEQTYDDPNVVIDHTYTLKDLNDSTTYNVKITPIDEGGNASTPVTMSVSTYLSPGAPEISGLKISTSIVPDRVETTQTIISWKTNKPGTSRTLFAEGSGTSLDQATAVDAALVRDHVVITTALRPGAVYTIVAESKGVSGEAAQSQPYTILTPQPRASVVDLIFKNLDTTFGFLSGRK